MTMRSSMTAAAVAAVFAVALGLGGCSTEEAAQKDSSSTTTTTKGNGSKTGKTASALWSCDTENTSVVCTAALPKGESDSMAYVCQAGDAAKRCPDAAALTNVGGLDALLDKAQAGDAFKAMPWACLVTGNNQFECIRDIARTAPGKRAGLAGAPGGGGERPAAPEGCDVEAWQSYFAKLASFEYQAAGVDITFPENLFDANANFVDVALGAAGGAGGAGGVPDMGNLPEIPANPGGGETPAAPDANAPSCHEGEGQMRAQSWLDVVTAGCMGNLTNANLVWCQQAANAAPKTGKCTATATW